MERRARAAFSPRTQRGARGAAQSGFSGSSARSLRLTRRRFSFAGEAAFASAAPAGVLGAALRADGAQVGREDLETAWPPFIPVSHGSLRRRPLKVSTVTPRASEARLDLAVDGDLGGEVAPVEGHDLRPGRRDDRFDDLRRGAAEQAQLRTERAQALVEGREGAVEPPPRRAPEGPQAGQFFIEDRTAQERPPAGDGGLKRRMVGDAVIVAKPD